MQLKKWCVPLLSLFLSTGVAEEIAEKEIVNSIPSIINPIQGVLDFKNFGEEQEISFDVINKNETITEEWPDYMEWMRDLKKNIYDFKIAVNSFSNSVSNDHTQFFYLNVDDISNEKKIEVIVYKHRF